MSQKQLKDTLDVSFTTYKRHHASLTRTLEEKSTSLRALNSKIDALESSLDQLNAAHTAWVSKADFSQDDLKSQLYSNEWLEQRWIEADVTLDKAKDLLLDMEEKSKPRAIQPEQHAIILKEQMEALKSSIVHRTASIAEQVTKKKLSSSAHTILSKMLEEAKCILNTDFKDLAKSLIESAAEKDNLADIVKSIEQFRLLQETQIVAIELDLANAALPSSEPSIPPSSSVSLSAGRGR